MLYDNLKSAVLERVGDCHPLQSRPAGLRRPHRYEPRPVAVARGNEKGRVESASIRYIRDNFFAARTFTDFDDLNAQAQAWCEGPAADRRWPEDDRPERAPGLPGRAAPACCRCPSATTPPLAERLEVHAGKTPYVRFDLNDYSIPHVHVRRTLVRAGRPDRVRVLDGATVLAAASAQLGQAGAQIEEGPHPGAGRSQAAARPTAPPTGSRQAVPAALACCKRAAARGDNLGSVTAGSAALLDRYGAQPMQAAVVEALAAAMCRIPTPCAWRSSVRREASQTPAAGGHPAVAAMRARWT
jgi:hypothetical protein